MQIDPEIVELAHATPSTGRLRQILVAEIASGLGLSKSATDELRALPINKLLAIVMALHASERVFRRHKGVARGVAPASVMPTTCEGIALVRAFTQVPDVEVRKTVVELLASFAALYAAFEEAAQRSRLKNSGQ
jgi:hypothetical protein